MGRLYQGSRNPGLITTNHIRLMKKINTKDFFLASWLHANAVPITGHVRESNRSTFTFSGEAIDKLTNEYYQGSATVNVATFSASIRQLKALMYNGTTLQPNNYYEQRKETQ